MLSIIYFIYCLKISFPYLKLSLFNFLKRNNEYIKSVTARKFVGEVNKIFIIPFIHYNVYTFYEQG